MKNRKMRFRLKHLFATFAIFFVIGSIFFDFQAFDLIWNAVISRGFSSDFVDERVIRNYQGQ